MVETLDPQTMVQLGQSEGVREVADDTRLRAALSSLIGDTATHV